jgi:hypothetical protein
MKGSISLKDWDYRTNSSITACVCDTLPHAGLQTLPTIAFDGTNYFLVWLNSTTTTIYGMRIDQSGYVVDTAALVIAVDSIFSLDSPNICFDYINVSVTSTI